jgi:hypothetical protein
VRKLLIRLFRAHKEKVEGEWLGLRGTGWTTLLKSEVKSRLEPVESDSNLAWNFGVVLEAAHSEEDWYAGWELYGKADTICPELHGGRSITWSHAKTL